MASKSTGSEKNPLFMLMLTGQIEAAEVMHKMFEIVLVPQAEGTVCFSNQASDNNWGRHSLAYAKWAAMPDYWFPEYDELYCNYSFVFGQDWAVLSGSSEGITQTAHRNRGTDNNFIWNFPIDVSFKSTNPHGWPKIVISVFGNNVLGRDEVRGYGSIHLPIVQGRHFIDIDMFVPEPTSHMQKLISWVIGPRPEFIDPKFIAQGEGREVTRVTSQGSIRLNVNVVLKDFVKQGFNNGSNNSSFLIHSDH